MTPEQFIEKWKASTRTEKSASQEHFLDLCELLEVPKPGDVDPHGAEYTFEKAAKKSSDGGTGSADVWKKDCFGWEYKGDRKNLVAAYGQVRDYAPSLGNPPLLIVSDMKEIRVHTQFTGTIGTQTVITLPELTAPDIRRKLRWAFTDPEKWRPVITREKVTTEAAVAFGKIAQKLRKKYEPRRVAHFLNKLVFCLFVEDIELLPDRVFADILEESAKDPNLFAPMMGDLFRAMRERNGRFGAVSIPWFNGGLFDDEDVLPLGFFEIKDLLEAARLDWSAIEPSIFGTLFERGLDPEKRKEMASLFDAGNGGTTSPGLPLEHPEMDKGVGIHYTDPATIMKLVEPVVLRPLRAEWEAIKAKVAEHRKAKTEAKTDAERTRIENALRREYLDFRDRLGKFRVLDPACGSGNFLYFSLRGLKDLDLGIIEEAKTLGLPLDDQRVEPDAVLGIEINPYAAELARVTIWIGELQWQMRNSFGLKRQPILGQLRGIVCRDALLNPDGTEAKWPEANVAVGNPPFLGDKMMIGQLGEDYVTRLRKTFEGRVPGGADLVTYWFEKARTLIESRLLSRAGLVATNSIRGGANRKILDQICKSNIIYDAWSDEPWILDGAAVRVSLICFAPARIYGENSVRLNGRVVPKVHPDLTGRDVDLTTASLLKQNEDVSFIGTQKTGKFDIPGNMAREWLQLPVNPHGKRNHEVIKPWANGDDITDRYSDTWIIDFGVDMSHEDAALYEEPFDYVVKNIWNTRKSTKEAKASNKWWLHQRPRPNMRRALLGLSRYICTPRVSKHRIFVWMHPTVLPDSATVVIARDDDVTFGVVHSHFHILWALQKGTSLEDRPRYSHDETFKTFPFPERLTPNIPARDYANDPRAKRIAEAARKLNELRENWLNPPDLVKRVPEVVPGYPDRVLPVNDKAAAILKKLTLTNLYNERPTWLVNAHRELDAAVAAAYGWPADLSDDEILKRLFALNQARAARDKSGGAKKAASPKSGPAPSGRAKRPNRRGTKQPKPARRKSRRAKRGK